MRQNSGKRTHIERRFARLASEGGETLTEVLVSVLVIALGMSMFLSAFLASGRMLQRGEKQMEMYYNSRNQLEDNQRAKKAPDSYVLEVWTDENGGLKRSLASNAYQTAATANYPKGQYPIRLYISQESEDQEDSGQTEVLYRYR